MQNLISKGFDGPNGVHAVFFFRPGIADENTILATYKEDEYGFVGFKPSPGEAMIDAGGYVGSTAILYAQLYPEARIFCVEPLPENIEIIKKNIETNHLEDRITLIQKALWSVSGASIPIFYRDQSTVGAVHKFVGSAFPNYHETVSKDSASALSISLPEIMELFKIARVRLLKMDIEGAEYEALGGCPESYLRQIQTMVGEYHNIHPGIEGVPRSALYSLVTHFFTNESKGAELVTWGSFLFESRI
jgi:FkbM family methyltransferase